MQTTDTILAIYRDRGSRSLPLERVYRHLFDPEFFLRAYGKIYRNYGAMTKGITPETVDGMSLQKIHIIIELLRHERYTWTPVRRTLIPKANGKMRPLGIPTWSDKLVQEVLRSLLEPYYEQRFSPQSHGFRPNRGCHTALLEIQRTWKGITWFIEGDIKGCFDNIDHTILLDNIRRDIHDGRIIELIKGLLKAGYMETWKYHETASGTPQGGIISPLLANIYLDQLDKFVADTLIPANTKATGRCKTSEYKRIKQRVIRAFKRGDRETGTRLRKELRSIQCTDPMDSNFRRLRYVRYADDFLLGFAGPKNEAEAIRDQLGEYLRDNLKLELSVEKTLVTHAATEKAKFLGHEITVSRDSSKRSANGVIALLMPQKAVTKIYDQYSKSGKIVHKPELTTDDEYTIVSRYQSVLRGIYNYYCMAVNVSKRMSRIKYILETSLTKTLAHKLRLSVNKVYRKYKVVNKVNGLMMLQVTATGQNQKTLITAFGGFSMRRNPEGLSNNDFNFTVSWSIPGGANDRSEIVQRLLKTECELCGANGPTVCIQMHHIRALKDLDKPGRRAKAIWMRIMIARKRKSLAVCVRCHQDIHAGRYDGPSLA
jgi:group II intron reverse transcriptase/maturase